MEAESGRMKTQLRYYFLTYDCVIVLTACQKAINHDAGLAGKRAVEFAQLAFVRQDKEISLVLLLILPLSASLRNVGNHAANFPQKVTQGRLRQINS
jgi:hypothetical protein